MLDRTTKSGIKPKCAVDGCFTPSFATEYCVKHYHRVRKHGDPLREPPETRYGCSVEGCNKVHEAHGLCNKHYLRFKKHGDPSISFAANMMPFIEDAVALAKQGFSKCIEWPTAKTDASRGSIKINGRSVWAYRVAYSLFSDIPLPKLKGMEIAHAPIECHNPKCINPNHLRLATRKENGQDMILDGTSARGEKHPKVKLTEENVRDIFHSKLSSPQLAKAYGVSRATIFSIKAGRNWGWLDKSVT